MSHKKNRPVVFLEYANERIDPARYLRNLSKEVNDIRDVMKSAKMFVISIMC